jgi:ABC-type bacteriocin/lantibiotic exporter with double-glycine peptidase domain
MKYTMKHLRRIQKTFVRQLGSHDCGTACVCMILKYSGQETEAASLRATNTYRDLSLLDLRTIGDQFGLQCKCVQMDVSFLSTNLKPCILHLSDEKSGNHFQVCYGKDDRPGAARYLMGDPARGIYFLPEEQLKVIWLSRAALYFEHVPISPQKQNSSSWHLLLSGRLIPTGLLFSIPLLSIFTAILGAAWSWTLQRGMYSSIAEKEDHLIEGMVTLLFVVTFAKNLFAYVRQQLMIRLNSLVNKHLTHNFMRYIIWQNHFPGNSNDPTYFKNGMSGMIKMQQAVSAFLATILSEGSILLIVLAALFYQSLMIGLINTLYLLITALYSYLTFPTLLFDHAHLNELSGSTERFILQDLTGIYADRPEIDLNAAFNFHAGNHSRYLEYAEKVSFGMSRNNLVLEIMGTCIVISVFIYGIVKMRDMDLSYSAFMILVILSYFITTLMPKICSALFVVTEGIEASRNYKTS